MSHTIGFPGEQNRGFQIGYNSGTIQLGHASDARQRPDPKTFWNVPFRRNPDFVDHGNVLPSVNDALARPSARFALTGIGGIGKSQFAIEFAYRCRERLSNNGPPTLYFWVDASSRSQFENSFIDIAVQLGLLQRGPEITDRQRGGLHAVKDWLIDERNGNWVLVVDNADDHSVLFALDTEGGSTGETTRNLANFLPQSPNGKVLITSRSKALARKLVGNRPADVLEVPPMPQPQALDLMRKSLSVDQSEEESALELLKALSFIPLAIVQASAYITQRSFASISSYLQDLRRGGSSTHDLLKHNAAGIDSMSILSTLQPSWHLTRKLRPTTVRLLSLMSFFNCQGIQTSLLRRYRYQYAYDCKIRHYGRLRYTTMGWSPGSHASQRSYTGVDQPLKKLSIHQTPARAALCSATSSQSPRDYKSLHVRCEHSTANNEKEFEEDVHVLQDLSLVSSSTDGSALQMHSLVQAAVWAWLNDSEKEKWKNLSLQVLAEEFPLYTEFEPSHICEKLVTHVEVDAEPPPYGDASKDWAQIIVAVGSYATDRHDKCLLRKTCEMALQFVNTHGREAFHKDVVFPLTASLAFQLVENGDCAAAGKLLNSLEDDRKSPSAHHPDLWTDMKARAIVCIVSGKLDEAEALCRKAIDTWRSIDGENGVRTMDAKHFLGISLLWKGRYEEVRSILSSLEGPYEEIYGEKDLRTLSANLLLARALHGLSEIEAAGSIYQRIMDIYAEGVNGYPHHEYVSAHRMAIIRQSQGRYGEAEILFRRALKRYEDTFGKEDSEYAELVRKYLESILKLQAEQKGTAELSSS